MATGVPFLAAQADLLALGLLRADAAGDAGQGVVAEQRVGGARACRPRRTRLDEARDVDARPGSRRCSWASCTGGSARPRGWPAARCRPRLTSSKLRGPRDRRPARASSLGDRSARGPLACLPASGSVARSAWRARSGGRSQALGGVIDVGASRLDGSAVGPSRRGTLQASRLLEGGLLELAVGGQAVGQLGGSRPGGRRTRGRPRRRTASCRRSTTRQPPHIPVPSTMIGLSETMVWTPNGRVSSAHGAHHRHRADGVDRVDAAGVAARP